MTHITRSTKPISASSIKRSWHVVDVGGKVLGRVCPYIAKLLQGKHKVIYTPYLDCGDYVVVINASKIRVTGKKKKTKEYQRYSGYPGGLKRITFERIMDKDPTYVIRHAVSGMLPDNKLKDKRLKRLFVFSDENHPYKNKINKLDQ